MTAGRSGWLILVCVAAVLLAVGSASAEDWPMLGHDAQRSGATREEIRGPMSRKWYRSFHEEGLSCGVQPIVANGTVYVGTIHGQLHAIDAETGKDRWSFQAGGGILHSAAVAEGACYFGAMDGKIYAVGADSGQLRWTCSTGKALWNAPIVAEKRVFIGGRDGFFYAIGADSGKLAWRTPVGGPILSSPAYDGGKVYVAGEDMRAYCFDARDGRILWTARLYGISARAYHPVIAGNLVMFTTQPGLGKFGPVDVLLEACRKLDLQPRRRIGADPRGAEETREQIRAKDEHNRSLLMDPDTLLRQLEGVREIHRQRPETRTFFAFDKNTGKEPWIAPICWEESCGGPGNPPVVMPGGRVIVKYALFTQARYDQYTRYVRAGYLDLKTGDITPLLDPFDAAKGRPIGLCHDEMSRLTGSSSVLIHARQGFPGYRGVVGLDLKSLNIEVLADNIHFGDQSIGPMNLLRLIKDDPIPPGLEYLTRGAGIFGGTGTYAAVAIADGTIYYIPGHEGRCNGMLIAWGMDKSAKPTWGDPNDKKLRDESYRKPENVALIRQQLVDWDMLIKPYGRCWPQDPTILPAEAAEELEARRAKAHEYAASIPREVLEKYIWQADPAKTDRAPESLRREINQRVEELISTRWMPLHFPDLMFGGIYFWNDPADLYQTLALAWPALDEPLKQKARRYAREEFAAHNPVTTKSLPVNDGSQRMDYRMPYPDARNWESRMPGIRRLYPLWAWADVSGEWDQLQQSWPQTIRTLIEQVKLPPQPEQVVFQNDLISGVIAYTRLARRFGDAEAEKQAVDAAVALLRARIEAERTYTKDHFHQRLLLRTQPSRYLFLCPELGRLIREHALDAETELYYRYVEHLRPTWYLAWGPLSYDAWETSIDRPNNSWAVFCARAMIFNDDGEKLARYIDLPWCKADLYHIQKLALLATTR
ncbi:MAG: PQQ-binding-like beta-propeller repeat protein [Planctomycetota bacterium]|nr:PQQ-binding-like beta-propeller repeat protein [Planctomycetota bacterium]